MHPESEHSPQAAPPPTDLAAHLRTAVGEFVHAIRAVDRLAANSAAVLHQLEAHGPLTTAELAASRGVRHQTMAATVRELVDAGYVAAERDPHDARKKALKLTDAGTRALEEDRARRVGVLARAVETELDAQEQRVLAHALTLVDRITASVAVPEGARIGNGRGPGVSAESTPASKAGPAAGAW